MSPALVIAGTGSGVGKTSLALGLARALSGRGLRVQPAKVGPDYLDPTHLAAAAGRPCWNLDPWMMGWDYVRGLLAAADADLLLIEGAMGLYDGANAEDDAGSTAELARRLGIPVWLIDEARGRGRSFATGILGFVRAPGAPRISGIIANRCGSERHRALLADALRSLALPPLLAALPEGALPELPSRHLGLRAADAATPIAAMAEAVAARLDPALALQHAAPPDLPPPAAAPAPAAPRPAPTLAMACDEACSFAYADLWPALERAGVRVVRCSPLADAALPDADGLYLPGGYPELHAARLAANTRFLAALRAFAASGRPVFAECGGLMLLSQGIELADGGRCAMAGVLPAWTRMLPRRRALGYAEVVLQRDHWLGPAGSRLRGHEFHYSELVAPPAGWEPLFAVEGRRGERGQDGWCRGAVLASYVHLHLPSQPAALAGLAAALRSRPC